MHLAASCCQVGVTFTLELVEGGVKTKASIDNPASRISIWERVGSGVLLCTFVFFFLKLGLGVAGGELHKARAAHLMFAAPLAVFWVGLLGSIAVTGKRPSNVKAIAALGLLLGAIWLFGLLST